MGSIKLNIHLIIVLVAALSVSLFSSCSKEDKEPEEDSQTFTLKGDKYSINIASLQIMPVDTDRSAASIILTGKHNSKIGTITFMAYFSNTSGIDGTYTQATGGAVGSAGTYPSHLATYSTQEGSDLRTGGYASGPLKITRHGEKEYTLEFDVRYEDETEASARIKRTFTTP